MQKFEELKRVCKWFTEEELACVENQATTNMQLTNTIQQARRLLKYRVN
ncbi:hypothetical protein [Staphylococcus felis]|uniref:Uncharacterized protein n=1 Tax=Staphylococcus felis TaxID=46127 RepID=A0ABS0QT01_9STAP|nr:hypothetical protein [Staphylococcus felis]